MKTMQLAQLKLPWALWLMIALVPFATCSATLFGAAKAQADARYVARDTFNLYRDQQTFLRRTDSLVGVARFDRVDSALAMLVRACRRKGECP